MSDITEELSKLLRNTKEDNNVNDYNDDVDKYDSDNDDLLMGTGTDGLTKELATAVSELKMDTLNILELLNVLNTEIDTIKDKINNIEQNNNTSESSSTEIDKIQERMDKILSVKLDEYNLKFSKLSKKHKN